jgi:ABC-type polysaccharide/polyol phosphate transport system ATPase subunit
MTGADRVAIHLQSVSVRYRVPMEPVSTLKEHAIRLLHGRRSEYREFMALDGIYLDVRRGEALGIIGRNGAGKSTLLKVVSRIIRPTTGQVWVLGKVAPLIELGAGFHPELTGRENVFMNGAMLGFSHKEMEARFESIVEFAELWDFIDAPIRTYSSGMMTRLGFAVASDVDPDILIIDEVLAVGDESFQQKCITRMETFRKRGTTILFVSHALDAVERLCERAVWIDQGKVRHSGDVDETASAYLRSV